MRTLWENPRQGTWDHLSALELKAVPPLGIGVRGVDIYLEPALNELLGQVLLVEQAVARDQGVPQLELLQALECGTDESHGDVMLGNLFLKDNLNRKVDVNKLMIKKSVPAKPSLKSIIRHGIPHRLCSMWSSVQIGQDGFLLPGCLHEEGTKQKRQKASFEPPSRPPGSRPLYLG